MFDSFFPKPKQFFGSAAAWAFLCVVTWFLWAQHQGESLSMGALVNVEYPESLPEGADEAQTAAHAEQTENAATLWHYQYMIGAYLLFVIFWLFYSPHRWARWSVIGSAIIVFVVWFQVQIDVLINDWFGDFYDMVQRALSAPNSITSGEFYGSWIVFAKLAAISITVSVINSFSSVITFFAGEQP